MIAAALRESISKTVANHSRQHNENGLAEIFEVHVEVVKGNLSSIKCFLADVQPKIQY